MAIGNGKPWRQRIPVPAGINTLCGPARVSTQVRLFGKPPLKLTVNCNNANKAPRLQIVTQDVGPFRLTGDKRFLHVLKAVFAQYKVKHPEAYADLTTAGCFCVRLVRGSKSQPSNHCWATASDFGFGGAVDPRGDGLCYQGMLDLYAIAKHHGLFWGASFGVTDPMHFEASEELLRKWESGL